MALALGACTSDSTDDTDTPGLPEVSGVEVTGAFGTVPEVEFTGDPGTELERSVLTEGKGDTVEKGDLIVVNYSGQVFGASTTFDSSFERPEPTSFPIGVEQVIKGWDTGLVGVKEGSRIVLSIPADQAYPEQPEVPEATPTESTSPESTETESTETEGSGSPTAETPTETSSDSSAEPAEPQGATPSSSSSSSSSSSPTESTDDTDPTGKRLVFVVDVIDTYGADQGGEADAAVQEVPAGTTPTLSVLAAGETADPAVTDRVTVEGALGKEATITVGADAPTPTEDKTIVLAKGTGKEVTIPAQTAETSAGASTSLIVQYQAVTFDGSQSNSTWDAGYPSALTVSDDANSGVTGLSGIPVGSRVVLFVAPFADDTDPRATATAVVVDILGQVPANDFETASK
jgi:peptidylprolyl isomerase